MSGDKATYTPREAAEVWEVSDQTVYRMIASGLVQVMEKRAGMFSRRYLISASEVARIREMLGQNEGNKIAHLAVA